MASHREVCLDLYCLMFIFYINDITKTATAPFMIKLYADDLKAYCTDINDKEGSNFKSALENIPSWANTWQLKISNEKSKWLLISNKTSEINRLDLAFELAGNHLTRVFDV